LTIATIFGKIVIIFCFLCSSSRREETTWESQIRTAGAIITEGLELASLFASLHEPREGNAEERIGVERHRVSHSILVFFGLRVRERKRTRIARLNAVY